MYSILFIVVILQNQLLPTEDLIFKNEHAKGPFYFITSTVP
jgi:hypothetical protein